MPFDENSPNIDALLLGTVLLLELSDRDRRVAARRYPLVKEHLERPSSALRPYLIDERSRIYPQGSRAIGATIVHGADDEDRFDLDAILEFPVPAGWAPSDVLDILEESLEGFPDAIGVKRCKRCVQLQFAFMHLDVTPMDPRPLPRQERVGDIFHAPGDAPSRRFAVNPYGFSEWFRETVVLPSSDHRKRILDMRKVILPKDRISRGMTFFAKADLDDLPADRHPLADAPQVLALKLMKRFLNLRYADRRLARPPSVLLTKMAALVPPGHNGLCAQLENYAAHVRTRMDEAIGAGGTLDERNPAFQEERLTDRWPSSKADLETLRKDMAHLCARLQAARSTEFRDIQGILSELFGERVTERSVRSYIEAAHRGASTPHYQPGAGFVSAPALSMVPAAAKTLRAPSHSFHAGHLRR